MTDEFESEVRGLPPEVRQRMQERMARMGEAQREQMRQRMAGMFARMDPTQRQWLRLHGEGLRTREANAPKLGDLAPEFDLAVLGGGGKRVRLSDLRGQPVGLLFGSYT